MIIFLRYLYRSRKKRQQRNRKVQIKTVGTSVVDQNSIYLDPDTKPEIWPILNPSRFPRLLTLNFKENKLLTIVIEKNVLSQEEKTT